MAHSRCKQSVYMPKEMLREMQREARRIDRPMSWMVKAAWTMAKLQIQAFPATKPGALLQEVASQDTAENLVPKP